MKTATVVLLLLLSACATPLPPCPEFKAASVMVEGRPYLIFDEAGTQQLGKVLQGLNDGQCKIAP